jgi:hypothetical protein
MTQLGPNAPLISVSRGDRPRGSWISVCVLTVAIAAQSGCTVYQSARRTLIQEPSEFSWRVDRGRSLKVYRQWADDAWAAERGACPDVAEVDDYALGFRDGFVDFVYAGGPGEPPPVPPRKFWNVGWRTPAGASAAQQWFAGYRHGSQVARDEGYRMGGVVNSAYAGTMPPAWSESASHAEPLPEAVPAPSEIPPDAVEALEIDGQTLPPPSDGPLPPQEEPPVRNLFDDNSDGPAEMPVPEAPTATDSTMQPSSTPTGQTASDLFRRAVSSAQTSNDTSDQR